MFTKPSETNLPESQLLALLPTIPNVSGANFMRKTLLFLLLILIAFTGFAQRPLTNSRQSSYYTYIYKLSATDVLNFYLNRGEIADENIVQHPIDSFLTDKHWDNNQPAGNYLKVYAQNNKLEYKLIENHSVWLKLTPNGRDLRFIFLDKQGAIINNALVMVNQKPINWDAKSGLYQKSYSRKDTLVNAEYGGVVNYFSIKQQHYYGYHRGLKNRLRSTWYSLKNKFTKHYNYRRGQPSDQNYTGFIVFNKPKYKPLDTVKFKAFILNRHSKKPITVPQLLVRLKENNDEDVQIIGKVNSYRDGGYEYSFVLSDSLKLSLDNDYTISLENPSSAKYDLDKYTGDDEDKFLAKRKVYITGRFAYEDYELKSIHFNMRTDKTEHRFGNPLTVYLKATDENDLPVPDGRVTLTLTTRTIHQYKNKQAFVPDTLWVHKLPLEPVGETKVVIPDSIFPKANIEYEINADFLTAANEYQSKSIEETFTNDKFNLDARLSGDTLIADYQENGRDSKAPAIISALNKDDDTLSRTKVILPYKIIINPNVASYHLETDSTDADVDIVKSENGFSLSGYRTADSLFVTINNPNRLHFWYSVFAGSKLIDAGQADSLFYKKEHHSNDDITFKVNYIWGGESKSELKLIKYMPKLLTINVKQPISVYPGEQIKTDILVTDVLGNPVPNTDVTAWSLTRKFTDYNIPNVPYLVDQLRGKAAKLPFNIINARSEGSLALNWARWGREIGLDSITYYQFTHPETIWRIEEPANDTITQVAPFVVKNGDILPVHILYIDERPVYFSQAEQLQRYSFRVKPGKHNFRFRTALLNINFDSVMVEPSKKLIFSINADMPQSGKNSVQKVSDTLSNYEADLASKYMINVTNNFEGKMAFLQQGDNLTLLNPSITNANRNGSILAGPLTDNYAQFYLRGEQSRYFLAEPRYTYFFGPGLLKQTSIPTVYPFSTFLWNIQGADDFKQYALTRNEADTIWQQALDLRSSTQWLFKNPIITGSTTGRLNIGVNEDKKAKRPFIKNIIIYKYDDPDFIRVYPGITFDMGNLQSGKYRLLFLLKGDSYYIADSIFIKPRGLNYYSINIGPSHPRDSVSIKINTIISNRTGQVKGGDSDIENDALKLKEAFNDKYFDQNIFGSVMSGRVLGEDDKLPIVGCSLRIKGTNKGAVTDVNGRYTLSVPASGKLIISYIGYQTKEIPIESSRAVEIKLKPSSSSLNEVVVVGYGTVLKKELGYSVQTLQGTAAGVYVSDGAPGAASTIFIRGIASFGTSKPLIIVDGVQVDNMNDINPNDIGEISVLKSSAASAIYGIAGGSGVIIINTKKKAAAILNSNTAQQADGLSIRKNFSDYAYWQPKLTTDANGKASFTSTFPDDITNWRTFVIGINDQKQSGYTEHQIKSFKPLSAALITPLFAVQGDEFGVIGKVTNYNQDAAKLTRTFAFNGQQLKQDAFEVKNSKIDTLNIITPKTDSLTFEYTIKRENGYFDGERRKIPVIEQGVKETMGSFAALNKDTTVSLNFDAALGPVTFRAEASILPAMAEEAQRLREYKYLCNEQLASKLKGLLAEKRIKTYLGEPFKWEKNILEVIKKLQDNRRSQGTWGWWKDTDEELWISLHSIEALTDAKNAGYTIDIDTQRLTDYLVYQMESYKSEEKLACLQLLHQLNAKVDYQKYFGVITKEFAAEKVVSKYDEFRLILLQQETGFPPKMDSILMNERHTLFGNIYWGEDGYRFFDNSVQLSVLAYKIMKNEGKHPELLEKISGYLLEQRRTGMWRNTYESSLILETLLPDLLITDKQVKPATLIIRGAKTDTVTKFPYTQTFNDKQLAISKTGTLPVYITGYQQFWNSHPEKVSKDFTVDTWFEKKGDKLALLKGGEPVQLIAEVTAKGDADYVMIEIPIPAGCSYESKEQSWQNNEVHREYFKEKVSIFCRKLKQGKYEFTVNLIPRFDGKYSLNPAKAEMMYFPVFYGREGMKGVVIGSLVH